MNSTPSTFARIIRLTALQPPPPTPITLIFAGDSSSLKLMRIPVSFAVIRSPSFGLENRLRNSFRTSRNLFTRLRTSLSVSTQCRRSVQTHCAALSHRTEPNRLPSHIPVAPLVRVIRKSPLAQRRERANEKFVPSFRRGRSNERRRRRKQNQREFA